MKKGLKIVALILCIVSVFGIFAACEKKSRAEKLEEELGVSYDNIVFRLELSPKYGFCCGRYTIVYTLYGDNRFEVYTGNYDYDGVKIDVIEQKNFVVDEASKQRIIKAIRDNEIVTINEIIPEEESFAIEHQLYLFDENGNAVHRCGGINPQINEQYDAVFQKIFGLMPYEKYTDLIDDTDESIHKITNEVRMEELGISFEHTIISYMCAPISEETWELMGENYEPWFDVNYTIRADGTLEVYTTEALPSGEIRTYCTETYNFSDWRVGKLLETIEEHMDFDHLYYTDLDAQYLYESGLRPASLLCSLDGKPLNGDEPSDEYAGYYMLAFHDSEGNPVCMIPAPQPDCVFESDMANEFRRDLMDIISFECPDTEAIEEQTRILMAEQYAAEETAETAEGAE